MNRLLISLLLAMGFTALLGAESVHAQVTLTIGGPATNARTTTTRARPANTNNAGAEAERLYAAGQYEQAAAQYLVLYQSTGQVEILHNIYLALRAAGHLGPATEALRRYVTQRRLPENSAQVVELRSLERQVASGATGTPATGRAPVRSTGRVPTHWATALGIVTLGLGGAALGGSVVTGFLATDLHSSLLDRCPDRTCEVGTDFQRDRDTGATLALTTDILLASGIVVAGTGIILLVLGLNKERDQRRAAYGFGLGCDDTGCAGTLSGSF